jgi:type I restriction enzyme M protein
MNREQLKKLGRDLWATAEKLRAGSDLKTNAYSMPVLGISSLRFYVLVTEYSARGREWAA